MNAKTWLALVALLPAGVAGCASAYHSYEGCCVDCQYCVPPPLPYVHYEGCPCHCCAAAAYLSPQPPPQGQAGGAEDVEIGGVEIEGPASPGPGGAEQSRTNDPRRMLRFR